MKLEAYHLTLKQVRQRLIEAENSCLEASWLATQAYADLLAAVGAALLAERGP